MLFLNKKLPNHHNSPIHNNIPHRHCINIPQYLIIHFVNVLYILEETSIYHIQPFSIVYDMLLQGKKYQQDTRVIEHEVKDL